MQIAGSTALVTGANRGLGRHFAQQLVARGATVYAGARKPSTVDLTGVIPLALDITDTASIAAAAEQAQGVSLLINNAGSFTGATLLNGDRSDIALEMDTHFFGPLDVIRAFAPQLAKQKQSAILNVLSVLSWVSYPGFGGYSAAKAAAWSLTNSVRQELAGQHTQVSGLLVGLMDTDMVSAITSAKNDPAVVARVALDGLEAGQLEILADETTVQARAKLAGGAAAIYPQFAS